MRQRKKGRHFGLMAMFVMILFVALLLDTAITALSVYLVLQQDVQTGHTNYVPELGRLVLPTVLICVPAGILLALLFSKVPLKPIRTLIESMDRLAAGDFGTRFRVGPIMRRYPSFVAVAESFNKMAEQLESTEMLRSDFINNFSHEFKTPIVSIAGFARLLNRGGLSLRQQKEYLQIIEDEALRLSEMATNVLNMTKVENQTILTDVTDYNLSEQLRSCILLLENKWSKKSLTLALDLEEDYPIRASEELLKQVWINLLDNAVKFSPPEGEVGVAIRERDGDVEVSFRNHGNPIAPEQQEKIFRKFYQADESHAGEGNGVGLAVVKRIVTLHGGSVAVDSDSSRTVFTVSLPQRGQR